MIILDILIYVAFAFFTSRLAMKSETYIQHNDIEPLHWDRYLTYFILFFTIIGALRWNVGPDSISYARIFAIGEIRPDSNEKIWDILVSIINRSGLHWVVGLGVCAFIQILFITKTLQPYRWLLVYLPFVFFGGRYWLDSMNAVRQMMAASMFLWASRFIYTREMWKYIVTIIAAALIHQSAILLLILYFIPLTTSITKYRIKLLIILIICFGLGQTPAFQGLANYVQLISENIAYDSYTDVMTKMLMKGEAIEALSFGPMMISYLLIPIFLIWFGLELEEKYSERIPYFNIWFNLAYFYACAYFLVCNISHLFIRPVMFFSLFQMMIAALLLYDLWIEYKDFGIRQTATIIFCCVIAINTIWDVAKSSGNTWESTTYKISFFHQDQTKQFGL